MVLWFLAARALNGAHGTVKRLRMPSAGELMSDDPRPPVLYLRSFGVDDQDKMFGKAGIIGGDWGRRSYEELIHDEFEPIGPVIAIAEPGDRVKGSGAARMSLPDEEWQSVVEDLMRSAAAVVFVCGSASEGFAWEIEKIVQHVDPTRVIGLVYVGVDRVLQRTTTLDGQKVGDEYQDWVRAVQKLLPKPLPPPDEMPELDYGNGARAWLTFADDWTSRFVALDHASAASLLKGDRGGTDGDVDRPQLVQQFAGHKKSILGVAVASTEHSVITSSDDGTMKVWNRHSGDEEHTLAPARSPVSGGAVVPTSDRDLLVAAFDGKVGVWDTAGWTELRSFKAARFFERIDAIAVTPDDRRIVTSASGKVKIWDLGTGAFVRQVMHAKQRRLPIAMTTDPDHIVTGDTTGVTVRHIDTGAEVRTITDEYLAFALTLSPDGSRLAVAVYARLEDRGPVDHRTVKIYDFASGAELCSFAGGDPVSAMAFTPDGGHLVVGSHDRTASVWRLPRNLMTVAD